MVGSIIKIEINGKNYQLLQPLPEKITSLNIVNNSPHGMQIPIDKFTATALKKWFNQIIDRLSNEWVSYNNVLIHKDDLKKFKQE